MSFEGVETLFHEFGHGLQHAHHRRPLSCGHQQRGVGYVELPSQFARTGALTEHPMGMARHWQTDEPLPEADYRKLCSSRTFMQGNGTSVRCTSP